MHTISKTTILCLLLAGCGSGGGETSSPATVTDSSASNTTTVSSIVNEADTFSDMTVPDNFDWQTHSGETLNLQLASAISLNNGEPLPLAGRHLTRIYALDENGVTTSTPMFTGMTDNSGKLESVVVSNRTSGGILVEVQFGEETCQVVLSPEEIETIQDIECEVLADSDL